MALATTFMVMDPCIAASGTVMCKVEEELNTGLKDQSSMETTSKVRKRAMVYSHGPMATVTKVTSRLTISMVRALTSGEMAACMLDSGRMAKCMAMAS